MKNKDIQFFFNRPDRPVNSGRITDIGSGKYSDSSSIPTASSAVLDAFLASFSPVGVTATISVPTSPAQVSDDGPMSDAILLSMFVKGDDGRWKFHLGETERHECKEGFGFRYSEKWLRAVAALANNDGGYVVIGVRDKSVTNGVVDPDSYIAKGMSTSEFENADPADFSMKLKSMFDPTPRIETKCISIDSIKIGIIYVHKHPGRPVIATRGEGKISEGDIFYRYPGQSSRIKYSDLQTVLDDRDRRVREQMLPMVEELLRLGPRDAMIADLSKGELRGDSGSILISEELVNKIKFIKEGEFQEKAGAPALRLIGDVAPVGAGTVTVQKTFVTVNSIIDDFLEQKTPFEPKDYIRCAVEAGNGAWLPMHYFAKEAALSAKQVEAFIMSCSAPIIRRETNRDRFLGINPAHSRASGAAGDVLQDILKGKMPSVSDVRSAFEVSRAIVGIENKRNVDLVTLLDLLKSAKSILQDCDKTSAMSVIRRAVARTDELFFS